MPSMNILVGPKGLQPGDELTVTQIPSLYQIEI